MDILLTQSLRAVPQIAAATALGVCLSVSVVFFNVTRQFIFKDSKEPPVVFHWVPFVGNAVSYGMDPYKFFADCQKKVSYHLYTWL